MKVEFRLHSYPSRIVIELRPESDDEQSLLKLFDEQLGDMRLNVTTSPDVHGAKAATLVKNPAMPPPT